MSEQKGIWKSTEELNFQDVLVWVKKDDGKCEVMIIPSAKEVVIGINEKTKGEYYEHANFSYDPQTKQIVIDNISTAVEISKVFHYEIIPEDFNTREYIFSTHKTFTKRYGWWWNRKTQIYTEFKKGDLIYRRFTLNTKSIYYNCQDIDIWVKN